LGERWSGNLPFPFGCDPPELSHSARERKNGNAIGYIGRCGATIQESFAGFAVCSELVKKMAKNEKSGEQSRNAQL
jgi:hypothetical protein